VKKFGQKEKDYLEKLEIDVKKNVMEEQGVDEESPEEECLGDAWGNHTVITYDEFLKRLEEKRVKIMQEELAEMKGKIKYQIKKRQISKSDVKVLLDKMKSAEEVDEDSMFKQFLSKAEEDEHELDQ
jgi:hypothetical protein